MLRIAVVEDDKTYAAQLKNILCVMEQRRIRK